MGIIKLPEQSIKFFQENCHEIFNSGELAEGKWNEKVAEWICKYTKSPNSLAFNSNGAGLFTILRLLKQYRSKRSVFLQSNTMYGVKTIAISSGLKLAGYVNCSLDYLMPTYQQVLDFVENLEKPEESVFLLTHIGGWINPDVERISKLCTEKGISLVEDCAHSLGSLLNDKHSGLFGVAGVYSLYATKTIPVGEGGILVTKDKELHEMAKRFVMYDRFDQKIVVGINLRMSEINALLTFAVLKETEFIINNKYSVAKSYIDLCKKNKIDYIEPEGNGQRSNLYKFILQCRDKDPLIEFVNIKSKTSPVYDYSLGEDLEEITKRHVCLPIWFNQSYEVTEKVLEELRNTVL